MQSDYLKIAGKVIHGRKEGRRFGFPTANLKFNGKLEAGVYSGWVAIQGQKYKAGIIYKAGADIIEMHILDFSGDLYGKKIGLEIGKKIRNIINFKNNSELISQIKKDLEIIKKE
ncbi:MAG TPA: riboflavin kinase [Candidatus Moranbacteria bacterium]|nr:riboflavin kinase [Candidatus Moranbacteria bacterium]